MFLNKKRLATIFIFLIFCVVTFKILNDKLFTQKTEAKETVTTWPIEKTIGNSAGGRNIKLYSYGNGPTHLLFVGGIHGGYEWNSVLLAYEFMDYLNAHAELISKNITIDIIPSANPDGVYKATNKDGRFSIADVSISENVLESARFNGNNVDLNRNFDCNWEPKSMWRSKVVDAGTSVFSEPEARAIRGVVMENKPRTVVFWHSKSNGVYASQCANGISPETTNLMNIYSQWSLYPAIKTFDAYKITGAAEDWLASINIPAITVELKTHETIELEENLAGIKAIIKYYEGL